MPAERVIGNLNRALHRLLDEDPSLYLLGEDVGDPYGGAFKATRGLSTAHSERVLCTPLSEGAIVGAGGGLALAGDAAIVEIMFGDFIGLAFDQVLNFASKSVSMYGGHRPMRLVIRCPTGGNRGYGPTHSQSPQKHFIGMPGLALYEMSPLHDNWAVLRAALAGGTPAILFEDKVLYTRRMLADGAEDGKIDDLFRFTLPAGPLGPARVHLGNAPGTGGPVPADCVLIAPGGMVHRTLDAMRTLLVEDEIVCELLVPSRTYPVDAAGLAALVGDAGRVCVIEESTAGGTWGSEVATALHQHLWTTLRRPVRLVHSADSIIPTAAHLEREVLVQAETIRAAVLEVLA